MPQTEFVVYRARFVIKLLFSLFARTNSPRGKQNEVMNIWSPHKSVRVWHYLFHMEWYPVILLTYFLCTDFNLRLFANCFFSTISSTKSTWNKFFPDTDAVAVLSNKIFLYSAEHRNPFRYRVTVSYADNMFAYIQ